MYNEEFTGRVLATVNTVFVQNRRLQPASESGWEEIDT
jgi:hypothetical protein